jgi:AraC-like DNA-binding protein
MFYLPRTALDRVAYEASAKRIGDLRHWPGISVNDPVVRHLLAAIQFTRRIPLSLLANECGLSVRDFARALRVSTGLPRTAGFSSIVSSMRESH